MFFKKISVALGLALLSLPAAFTSDVPAAFIRGFDASMVDALENDAGLRYKDASGKNADPFVQLKENGVDFIRLRLWNRPASENSPGDNDLARTIRMAKRARDSGMEIFLDFHFSDTWTDPEHAKCPSDWKDAETPEEMGRNVALFVGETLAAMKESDVLPRMVQIGNECENGYFLEGVKNRKVQAPSGSANFILYANAAAARIREADPSIKIVMHASRGGNDWVVDHFLADCKKIDYDVVGLSYYPFFESHGKLSDLRRNIRKIRDSGKEVIVAETSFAWTCDWVSGKCDEQNNQLWYWSGNDGLVMAAKNLVDSKGKPVNGIKLRKHEGRVVVAPTVENQALVVEAVMKAASEAGASGLFYWGGDWITSGTSKIKSSMENQAFWDYDHRLLESIRVFNK